MGSSEIWRFRQYKDAFFERFWVKMCRFLSSGNRKKQNRRGRILMAKEFQSGDVIRMTAQLLDAQLKGMRAAPAPVNLMPLELEDYSGIEQFRKRRPAARQAGFDTRRSRQGKREVPSALAAQLPAGAAKNETDPEAGYFEIDRSSDLFPAYLKKRVSLDAKKEAVTKKDAYFEMDLPAGVWRVTVPISAADEQFLTQKITIRKPLPPELNDVRPDLLSLAAIASEVDELKPHVTKKPEMMELMRGRAFKHPAIQGDRLMFHFNDRQALDMIPDCIKTVTQDINNPVIEPEIRRAKSNRAGSTDRNCRAR